MEGLVVRNTGYSYRVRSNEGALFDCKVKGNFRLKGIRSTNPVAVGDHVTFYAEQTEGKEQQGWITELHDRRNYIIRRASNLSAQSHILAANVDRVLLTITVNYPENSTTFIDRVLATAEAYRIPVIIAVNKMDRYNEAERHFAEGLRTLYESLGYTVRFLSALQPDEEFAALQQELSHGVTLLSGNSGVGKSTLLNLLIPDADQKTAEISDAHNTGMHTTTFSEMFQLKKNEENREDADGWIIDTPGVKGFGTFDMEREEVGHYFREIFHYSHDCRYGNCLHLQEPGCAVRPAVDEHLIAASRYNSYPSMLEDKEESKYR